jgi:hypothetical protein
MSHSQLLLGFLFTFGHLYSGFKSVFLAQQTYGALLLFFGESLKNSGYFHERRQKVKIKMLLQKGITFL